LVDGGGDAQFGPAAGDVAVEGIDFGTFAALKILRCGGVDGREGFGDFVGAVDGVVGIFEIGEMDFGGAGNGEKFGDEVGDDFFRFGAGGDFAVAGVAESGDDVERAIPGELGPEFAFDVVGDAAGDLGTFKESGDFFGAGVARADDEIAAAAVLDRAGFGDERADVDDSADGVDVGGGAELVGVVDSILHADDGRAGSEERGDGARGCGVVDRFHAEEDDFGAAHGFELIGGLGADAFLEVERVEQEAVGVDGGGERGAADEGDGGSGASEHAAEVAADRAGSYDRDLWPGRRVCSHVVITEIRRSMSRSVLKRCGETRIFPSRKLVMIFSLVSL